MRDRQRFTLYRSLTAVDVLLIAVCLGVLFFALYYPYTAASPELGFTPGYDWKVASAYPCGPRQDGCLKVGDQILSIRGVTHEEFISDRTISVPELFGRKGVAHVRFVRDGRTMEVDARIRGRFIEPAQL